MTSKPNTRKKAAKKKIVYALVLGPHGDEKEIFKPVVTDKELAALIGGKASDVVAENLRWFGAPAFYPYSRTNLQQGKIAFRAGSKIAFSRAPRHEPRTDWVRWFISSNEDVYGPVVIYHPQGAELFDNA
jgi:hypothetical protein